MQWLFYRKNEAPRILPRRRVFCVDCSFNSVVCGEKTERHPSLRRGISFSIAEAAFGLHQLVASAFQHVDQLAFGADGEVGRDAASGEHSGVMEVAAGGLYQSVFLGESERHIVARIMPRMPVIDLHAVEEPRLRRRAAPAEGVRLNNQQPVLVRPVAQLPLVVKVDVRRGGQQLRRYAEDEVVVRRIVEAELQPEHNGEAVERELLHFAVAGHIAVGALLPYAAVSVVERVGVEMVGYHDAVEAGAFVHTVAFGGRDFRAAADFGGVRVELVGVFVYHFIASV